MVQKMGPNAYKLDLPADKYGVHTTFNVADLSLFIPDDTSDDDSRTNRDQVEENDSAKSPMAPDDIEDKMRVPFDGPITRARAKMIHGATQALLIRIGATLEVGLRPTWVTLLQAQTTAQDLILRPHSSMTKTKAQEMFV